MSAIPSSKVLALYRASLREAGRLPHPYLREFFKGTSKDYFRKKKNAYNALACIKHAQYSLRRLRKANLGDQEAFQRVLNIAFGRSGRLRRELLQVHVTSVSTRDPIIPGVERSRPPTYSPTLMALVGSDVSKTTAKAYSSKQILDLPNLPERAQPGSTASELLGPFSRRRLVNAHQKFYDKETSRILPPLEVNGDYNNLAHPPPFTGLETLGVIDMLEKLSLPPSILPNPLETTPQKGLQHQGKVKNRSQRWLRRRYRELLSRIPALTVKESSSPSIGLKIDVSRSSPLALSAKISRPTRNATSTEMEWVHKSVKSKE